MRTELHITEGPFGGGESSSGSVEPSFEDNASLATTRLEARDDLRRGYEQNIGTVIEMLEDAEGSSIWGSSDVSSIPLTIEGLDDDLEDPFQGELDGLTY